MRGLVLNLQRYSIHDGTGIRTIVFFKGCPLRCPWCSNPESQSFEIEKGKIKNLCIKCKTCSLDVDECPSGAITQFGKYMTVEEVLTEVEKDMIFYNTSGGGVTLSGGEATAQPEFALELLKELKKLGISTALETSGQVANHNLMALSEYLDLILFDLKIMNKEKSKELLGADIDLIKGNFKALIQHNKMVIPRIPLIPGYTMDDENIGEIISFVKELGLKDIHILPFHQYGSKKYEYIGKEYKLKDIKPPTKEEVEAIKTKMEFQGLKVVIGGL